MSLAIWFEDDVRRALLSIDEANLASAQFNDARDARIYRQGFAAAIRAVATAFGVTIPGPIIFEFFTGGALKLPELTDQTGLAHTPISVPEKR